MMEDHEIPKDGPSDWQPITDKADLAVLGKLGEELCEAGSAVFRCIIQGIYEAEPRTGVINKNWLENEIADVEAMIMHAKRHFTLSTLRMQNRTIDKYEYKRPWFEALEVQDDDD
jgi:hypothetical protein